MRSRQVGFILFVVAMLAGWWVIAAGSLSYFEEGLSHPFLHEKEGLAHEQLYLVTLQAHVVSAVWSLPACVLLPSRRLLRAMPRVHRWVGRITAFVVLCGLVPSGAWLSFQAKGGALGTLGFLLSGGIVALAMVRGVQTAMARDFVAHRRSMLHVGAQLSVAVTSRALLIAFAAFGVDEIDAYLVALWVPVVASALLAQWIATPASSERKDNESLKPLAVSFGPAR
jgi:predicted membrane protein DUF2306